MAKKLYIGNLKFGMTDQDLREAFAGFGEIVSATIIKDKASGRSKGFGFIEFANEADAQKAKTSMNGKEVQGRALRIDDAKSQ
ncbi:MAG: RNA recognition motif domain-containing protein [bacterium]